MQKLLRHRGPDAAWVWHEAGISLGLCSVKLNGQIEEEAPKGADGSVLAFDGNLLNTEELASTLGLSVSISSAQLVLAAYAKYGLDTPLYLRGAFAFVLYDRQKRRLVAVRDIFGAKPLYYASVDGRMYLASEIKALLPFVPEVSTNPEALAEYLTFQYTIGAHTMFAHINQVQPAHSMVFELDGRISEQRYWRLTFTHDFDHTDRYFIHKLQELLEDSVKVHVRGADTLGAYISGGVDSSMVARFAAEAGTGMTKAFTGTFPGYPDCDESAYAREAAKEAGLELCTCELTHHDFQEHIADTIYTLEHPVAGPGSFNHYMMSRFVSRHVKTVLGGQGGDEIFGGYARYLVAYLEQCLKAAMEGTYKDGSFVVTFETILPNMPFLADYKPMIAEQWREGLFASLDERYFRLINRASDMTGEIAWEDLPMQNAREKFFSVFNNFSGVHSKAYFDRMTYFDFTCSLPALLQVDDRTCGAFALDGRAPLLDRKVVEFAATVPAIVKFPGGKLKHLLIQAGRDKLPKAIVERASKMGFPIPLRAWFAGPLREFLSDMFQGMEQKNRPYMNAKAIHKSIGCERNYSRKTWALLSLELWHQQYHDSASKFRDVAKDITV